MGIHRISSTFTAQLLGIAPASVSAWLNGRATPSLSKAVAIAELFEISVDRLLRAPFVDLLTSELADRQRFEQVEARIQQHRGHL
jgi:transcriptional regulator with XRE-family HTH domain